MSKSLSQIYFFKRMVLIICVFIMSYTLHIMHSDAQLISNLGGQRAGISAFSFLKSDISPRAIAMGGAITNMKGDGYSSQWNPATLTDLGSHNFAFSTRMYALGINQSFAAANIKLRENDYMAVSINNLNSGNMEQRTEFQPYGTGQLFGLNSMGLGISYAKALTYKFSIGASVKYVREDIDRFISQTVAVDVGFIYKTDFKDLRFGVMLQIFGPNAKATGNYDPFNFAGKRFTSSDYPTPTVFKFGASMVPFRNERHSLAVSAELNHPGDNATNIRFGAEYNFLEILYLRAGYWLNVPGVTLPTAGLGVRTVISNQIIHLNYAVASTNALGTNHNIGLSVTINNPKQESTE